MLGHATYHITAVMLLLFSGPSLYDLKPGHEQEKLKINSVHYTFIFNTFVWMQLFKEINCRKLKGEKCVYYGVVGANDSNGRKGKTKKKKSSSDINDGSSRRGGKVKKKNKRHRRRAFFDDEHAAEESHSSFSWHYIRRDDIDIRPNIAHAKRMSFCRQQRSNVDGKEIFYPHWPQIV